MKVFDTVTQFYWLSSLVWFWFITSLKANKGNWAADFPEILLNLQNISKSKLKQTLNDAHCLSLSRMNSMKKSVQLK